jgi:putative transcriptional regulator
MDNYIKCLRKEKKLTQEKLAEQLNVSRQTVISIESGKYDPSLPPAFKISEVLKKPIEEIFVYEKSRKD